MKKFKFFVLLVVVNLFFVNIYSQSKQYNKNDITYAFIEALKSETFGNYGQAIYLFQNCLQNDTTCAACYYEVSKLYLAAGEKKSSLYFAQKAASIDDKNYWYLKNLGDIQVLNELYSAADSTYKKLFWTGKIKLDDRFAYANILFHLNKGNEALKILDDIVKENGFSEMVSNAKYNYYLNIKKYDLAENEIKLKLKYYPEKWNYYGMLAEIEAIKHHKKEALEYYQLLLKNDPKNIAGLVSFGRFYVYQRDTVDANIYFNRIFNDTSISITNKIDAIHLFENEAKDSYSVYYLSKKLVNLINSNNSNIALLEAASDFFDKEQNYKQAEVLSEYLIKANENNSIYWERYFYYNNILGNYKQIAENTDMVLNKFQDRPLLYLIGGIAKYQMNDYKTAINFLKDGFVIASKNELVQNEFINYLSEAYYKIGMKDSAYYYFEKGINFNNPDIILINNYAYYLADNGDRLEKANAMSYQTIRAEPKNSTFLDTYAWTFYKLKDYKNAYKYIKLAKKYDREHNPDILEHYGDISFCYGKISAAKKYWSESMKYGGNIEKISKKLNGFKCN